jgi:hypothetical protein
VATEVSKQVFVLNDENKDRALARLIRFVHAWNFAKHPLEIACERFSMGRTIQQNKALFGHAYKILRGETGHSLDELHDFFCRRFFGVVEHEMFGVVTSRPARTTTTDEHGNRDVLKWDRFSEFFEAVREFAASELGVAIPDPDPDWWKHVQSEQKEAA